MEKNHFHLNLSLWISKSGANYELYPARTEGWCSGDRLRRATFNALENHGILNETEQREHQVFGLVFQAAFGWGMLRVHAAHIRFESLGLIICHCSWFPEDNTNLVHRALLGSKLLRLPHATFQEGQKPCSPVPVLNTSATTKRCVAKYTAMKAKQSIGVGRSVKGGRNVLAVGIPL